MLRAVYVRTLKPGVTDEQFIEAWMPPRTTLDSYPAQVSISRGLTNERQVISEIVESTQLEAVYEDTTSFGKPHIAQGGSVHAAAGPKIVEARRRRRRLCGSIR